MGVQELQQFATALRKSISRKSIINILSSVFAVFNYAGRCGIRVPNVRFKDLELGAVQEADVPFFTREQATKIINAAKEPYKTLFSVAWYTGMRAGEILALTRADLDFDRKTIRVNKSADDRGREIRQPKTKNSVASLPMPSALEAVLRNYFQTHWKPNPTGLVFPNRACTRPRKRESVVQYALKPLLRKLYCPDLWASRPSRRICRRAARYCTSNQVFTFARSRERSSARKRPHKYAATAPASGSRPSRKISRLTVPVMSFCNTHHPRSTRIRFSL